MLKGLVIGFFSMLFLTLVSAQSEKFTPPWELRQNYCVNQETLANYTGNGYQFVRTDGFCYSYLRPDLFGVIGAVLIPGNCTDGKQSLGEGGVDCGGSCDAQCVSCIDSWTSTYWPISVPSSDETQTGPRFLQLSDEQLLIRSYDTLYEYADEKDVLVSSLDTSDEVLEAVAWYVDDHMNWLSDSGPNPSCINDVNNLNYNPGWDFPIPASYTVGYTGNPTCGNCTNDFCGDCEDHGILRQALAKRIGVSSKCVFDAIDLNDGGKHEYNIVLYKGKYRLMDYGTMDSWLDTHTWNAHETEDAWNYVYGPRPPWLNEDNLAEVHSYNYPLSGPLATPDKVDCPATGWNYNTYYEDTCP